MFSTFLWWSFQYTTLSGLQGAQPFFKIWKDGLELNLTLVAIGSASFYYTYWLPGWYSKGRRWMPLHIIILILLPAVMLLLAICFSEAVLLMFRYFLYFGYVVATAFLIAALALRYLKNWRQTTRSLANADRNAAILELEMLKSQLSPHFLFNTLNNIDALITLDPQQASAYLNKLAELLRFMLYQTSVAMLALKDELFYLRQYLELQRIRSVSQQYCRLSVEGDAGEWQVVPLLFLPLVENAFKHCSSKSSPDSVVVHFDIDRDRLMFRCENSYIEANELSTLSGGIGTPLIRRRLELAYPDKHVLEVVRGHGRYEVNLTIYA